MHSTSTHEAARVAHRPRHKKGGGRVVDFGFVGPKVGPLAQLLFFSYFCYSGASMESGVSKVPSSGKNTASGIAFRCGECDGLACILSHEHVHIMTHVRIPLTHAHASVHKPSHLYFAHKRERERERALLGTTVHNGGSRAAP